MTVPHTLSMLAGMNQRVLQVLAIVVFAAWCVIIQANIPLPDRGNDFPAFYTVAQAPWSKIYDLDHFTRFQLELRRPWGPHEVQPFPRAPIYAVLLKPFALFSYRTAVPCGWRCSQPGCWGVPGWSRSSTAEPGPSCTG